MKKQPPKRTSVAPKKGAKPSSTLVIDVLPPGGVPSQDWLRETATYVYTTAVQKVTLQDLVKHPLFAGNVSIMTLERWCKDGQWVELRRQNAEEWRKKMVRETGRELVEFRREQLKKLKRLSEIMFKELLPTKNGSLKLSINSYESMVQAFVKVATSSEAMTQASMEQIMPDIQPTQVEGPTEQSEVALKVDMTLDEARIGAKAILAARREEQRRLMGIQPALPAPEPKGG